MSKDHAIRRVTRLRAIDPQVHADIQAFPTLYLLFVFAANGTGKYKTK